jgi:oxalate decarboxylase/phosphoglucose isomerase-like protein (cupin superfamily)
VLIISTSEAFVIHENDRSLECWEDPSRGTLKWKTLVSNDITPSDSMTAGIGELEPGMDSRLEVHAHEQPEIYYLLEGKGVIFLDGGRYELRPGHAVFIPSNARHGIQNTGKGPLRFFYVFPTDRYSEVRYSFTEGREK